MINLIKNYYRNRPLNEFLDSVHEEMWMKYKIQKQAEQQKINAQKIELFLRTLKQAANNPMTIFEEEFLNQVLEIMNANSGRKNKLTSASQLFKRSHFKPKSKNRSKSGGVQASTGFDDIFEEEFAAVLIALMGTNSVQTMAHEKINTPLFEMFNEGSHEAKQFQQHYMKKVKKIVEENAIDSRNEMFTGVKFESGKTDISTTGFNIEGNVVTQMRPEWQEALPLLQKANFSLKNYSSSRWMGEADMKNLVTEIDGDIHLGNTNVYKAITSALISLGVNFSNAQSVFYRGYWGTVNKNRKHPHLYHLRFLYELSGAGAITKNGEQAAEVNYIVFNDPASDNIYVKSVAELIVDMLNNTQGSGLFSNVKISKKKFYSSK